MKLTNIVKEIKIRNINKNNVDELVYEFIKNYGGQSLVYYIAGDMSPEEDSKMEKYNVLKQNINVENFDIYKAREVKNEYSHIYFLGDVENSDKDVWLLYSNTFLDLKKLLEAEDQYFNS